MNIDVFPGSFCNSFILICSFFFVCLCVIDAPVQRKHCLRFIRIRNRNQTDLLRNFYCVLFTYIRSRIHLHHIMDVRKCHIYPLIEINVVLIQMRIFQINPLPAAGSKFLACQYVFMFHFKFIVTRIHTVKHHRHAAFIQRFWKTVFSLFCTDHSLRQITCFQLYLRNCNCLPGLFCAFRSVFIRCNIDADSVIPGFLLSHPVKSRSGKYRCPAQQHNRHGCGNGSACRLSGSRMLLTCLYLFCYFFFYHISHLLRHFGKIIF